MDLSTAFDILRERPSAEWEAARRRFLDAAERGEVIPDEMTSLFWFLLEGYEEDVPPYLYGHVPFAIRLMIRLPGAATVERLRSAARIFWEGPESELALLVAAAVPVHPLLIEGWGRHGSPAMLCALAGDAGALRLPGIRERIAAHGNCAVLAAFLPHATPEERPTVIRRMFTDDPHRMVAALLGEGPSGGSVPLDVIGACCGHSDAVVREAGVQLVARVTPQHADAVV